MKNEARSDSFVMGTSAGTQTGVIAVLSALASDNRG
jgi:hypothetical protein